MRQFLETNKVYFETVVAILLGIMAVIVSASQAWLAYKSYGLTKLSYLPQIAAEVTMGGERCGANNWKLTTTNLSGSGDAYDVRVHAIAFFSIRQLQLLKAGQRPNPNIHLKSALIPLRGYFSPLSYGTSATKGKLVVQCTEPLNAMDSSEYEFETSYAQKGKKSITSNVEIYMAVSYKNRFRNSQTKYFEVNAGGQAVPVSSETGEIIFHRYTGMIDKNQYLEYGSSTGKEIMRVWRMNAS